MTRKYIIIILILFFFISFNSDNYNSENFKYIINKQNIICHNTKIKSNEIDDYILYYEDKINQIYLSNELTDKKISEQNLIIVLCKESFKEWDLAIDFKSNLKKELKFVDKKNSIFEENFAYKDEYAKALYIDSYKYPMIILKSGFDKRNKFILTISEYNHFLISKNFKKHIDIASKNFYDYTIFNYLLDEGFTSYISLYLDKFSNPNYGNFIYENINIRDINNAKLILDSLIKLYKKNEFPQELYSFSFSDLFNNKNKIPDSFIGYNSILFYSYIHYIYSDKTLFSLLDFLYNNEYFTVDEIFLNIFNKDVKTFLSELDKILIK